MGLAKNQKHEQSEGKSTRGSTKNSNRLAAFAAKRSQTGADWGGCDPDRLQCVIVQITELGGAVTFGLSRDKGAHSLTLMLDGKRETMWFNGDADLNEALADTIGTLEAMS